MSRKIWSYIKIIMTFLMLFYVLYIIFAAFYYPKKMQEFCNSITMGESIKNVITKANNDNYKQYEFDDSKELMVFNEKVIGKASCSVSYDLNEKIYAKSYMDD